MVKKRHKMTYRVWDGYSSCGGDENEEGEIESSHASASRFGYPVDGGKGR
jgi:hypothetical protein